MFNRCMCMRLINTDMWVHNYSLECGGCYTCKSSTRVDYSIELEWFPVYMKSNSYAHFY